MPETIHEICSGGERHHATDPVPALFINKALAQIAYDHALAQCLKRLGTKLFRTVEPPVFDKWQITVMDSKGMHRVAEPRWSVTAKIAVIRETEAA